MQHLIHRLCLPFRCSTASTEGRKKRVSNRVEFVAIPENLVDAVWADRPPRPANSIVPQPLRHSGETVASKVKRLREKLHKRGTEALLVQSLDSVAWLLNLRGSDVPYNPVFFSYALVVAPQAEGAEAAPTAVVRWYVRPEQVTEEVKEHLKTEAQAGGEEAKQGEGPAYPGVEIQFRGYEDFIGDISQLRRLGTKAFLAGAEQRADGGAPTRIWVDPSRSSVAVHDAVVGGLDIPQEKGRPIDLEYDETPISILKAVKNDIEIEGFRQSHLRDAVAVCQYLHWLETGRFRLKCFSSVGISWCEGSLTVGDCGWLMRLVQLV